MSNHKDKWYSVVLTALYLSNIPQILQKTFSPGDYLSILSIFTWDIPQKIGFMRGLFSIIFVLIIPILIALIFSQSNLRKLEEFSRFLYWSLWLIAGLVFMFYLLTEISGISKI